MTIYDRVAAWNALRYEQEYNEELALLLLAEEIIEAVEAKTDVDRLDAYCDIAFVCLGIKWKLGGVELQLESAAEDVVTLANMDIISPVSYMVGLTLDLSDGVISVETVVAMCIEITHMLITASGVDYEEAMNIVCDSNDTKDVYKTPSNEKGSCKGEAYIAPEARLKLLLA